MTPSSRAEESLFQPGHQLPSASRIPVINDALHNTPPADGASRETVHPTVTGRVPVAREEPLEISNVEHQQTAQLGDHSQSSDAAPGVNSEQIESEPAHPWGNCPYPHVQSAQEATASLSQPELQLKGPNRHRPFGALSGCCSTSRPETPPPAVQPPNKTNKTLHTHSLLPGICCLESHYSSEVCSLKDLGSSETRDGNDDIENGPPNFERVVLRIDDVGAVLVHAAVRIDGLKCGCCEGGLSRALDRITAVKNHQVNVILARVEFDLDTNRLSVGDVIKLLTTRTGYKFEEQVASDGQILELIVTDPRLLVHAGQPKGVIRIEAPVRVSWRPLGRLGRLCKRVSNKSTRPETDAVVCGDSASDPATDSKHGYTSIRIPPVRLYYDPNQIGARTVFEHYRKYDPDLCLAPPATDPSIDLGAKQIKRALLWFLPTLALTIPVLVFAWTPLAHTQDTYMHISLALASLVQLIAFREFVPGAWRSLYHSRVFEMDFLIAFSTTMAYTFSVVSYVFQVYGTPLETGSFFETSTLLVTLILLGRVINEFARYRAAKSVSFRSLQVEEARLVLPSSIDTWANVKTTKIDSRLLQYGDFFTVPPHTRIVTDGIVVYGGSNVDESMITGEFQPKAKGIWSEVFAGTNNQDGSLVVSLSKLPHENSIHQIATMVEDAELTKPKVQALADWVAGWFVPVIAVIGTAVFLTWMLVDRYQNHHMWKSAVLTATTYAIATLIVSCPCAIGLAVPMVVIIASGVAARYGIILRDPQMLEVARKVTDVVFDKTGTITSGRLDVVSVPRYRSMDRARTKGLLLGLLKDIQHPVAAGITKYLTQDRIANKDFEPLEVNNIVSFPGEGVQGVCAQTGDIVRAGNAEWLKINVIGRESNTRCYFTVKGELQASFELKDRPRPGAEMVIEKLHTRGIRVHMISGDTEGAVTDVASSLHIQKEKTKSRCKPEGKCTYVKDLQKPGKVVMFVGDGVNDSVALKQADIGVHVSQGSDVAKSAADVVLMTTRLHDILILLDISGTAYRRIIANFSWSCLYNVGAILLAAGAFVEAGNQIRIAPQWAGLGELVSVLPVVLIAFQMRWRDYGSTYRFIENDYQKVEAPKRERVLRIRGSSSTDSAECCEISSSRLAKIDAVTR